MGAQFPHTKWHSNGTRPTHTHPPVCFKFSPDTLPNSISILYKYLIILRCLGNNGKGESLCVSNTERSFFKMPFGPPSAECKNAGSVSAVYVLISEEKPGE